MSTPSNRDLASASTAASVDDVLRIIDDVATRAGIAGDRRHAQDARASLQKDWGFGSLELVELRLALECSFEARVGEAIFELDTAAALSNHLRGVSQVGLVPVAARVAPVPPRANDTERSLGAALARRVYTVYAAIVTASAAAILLLGSQLMPEGRSARAFSGRVTRAALRLLGCRLVLETERTLDDGGPWLLAANHASLADAPTLMGTLPFDFVFVAKREVLRWPIVGRWAAKGQHITVDRKDARDGLRAAREVSASVRAGRSVLLFPEGTFVPQPGVRRFRLGAFSSAVETGTPVVPIAIRGTRNVLRFGSPVPHPGTIHVWVGAPIAPEGRDFAAAVKLRDRVAEAIAERVGEPRLDELAVPVPKPTKISARERATSGVRPRPLNWARSVLHVSWGLTIAVCFGLWGAAPWLRAFLTVLALSAWTVEAARRKNAFVNRLSMAVFGPVAHAHEWDRINSASWYVTALCVLAWIAPANVAALGVIVLAIADPIAGLIGRRFGKRRLRPHRTLEGSLAFLVSAFAAALALQLALLPESSFWHAGVRAGVAALCGAVAELYCGSLDDNLTVPLAAALGASLANQLLILP